MFAFTQTEKCGKMMAVKEYGGQFFSSLVETNAGLRRCFMERWENRYAHSRSGSARGVEHSRADRVRSIVIILLVVALTGVGIVGGQAIAFRGECKDTMVARALTECNDAVGQVNTMSRSGGSDTAALLGKIRANVHAVEMLSSLSVSLYGDELAPATNFTELYGIIDSYSAKLKNGSAAIEELTNLSDRLSDLQLLLQKK